MTAGRELPNEDVPPPPYTEAAYGDNVRPIGRRQSTARVEPHNLEAEACLLGAMLLSPKATAAALELHVTAADFYRPAHGHIYEAIEALNRRGDPADPVTVADELQRAQLLAAAGGADALVGLQAGTPAISNAGRYARIVKDLARLRGVIHIGAEIGEMGYSRPEDVATVEQRALDLVATLHGNSADRDVTAKGQRVLDAVRSTEDVLSMPPPTFLVDEWIVDGALVCVYGKPATFKSLIAQSWALCFATGLDWYGRAVTPSRVLYVAAEGASGLAKRINAWLDDAGIPAADTASLLWLPMAVNLLDAELADGLVAAARLHEADIVFIDTVARSLPGAPENDGPAFSTLVAVADRLRALDKTVVLIHHSPKDGHGMRGHTNLEGAVDTAIEVKREPRQAVMSLTMTKQKDFAEADDITFKLRAVGESVVLDHVPNGRGTVSAAERHVLDAIWDTNGTGATAAEIEKATGMSKSAINRHVNNLREHGHITNLSPHGAARWNVTEPEQVP